MRPIKTPNTNFLYSAPGPGIDDLPAYRGTLSGGPQDGANVCMTIWQPDEEERRRIAAGENIQLVILFAHPIPPVDVRVVDEREIEHP